MITHYDIPQSNMTKKEFNDQTNKKVEHKIKLSSMRSQIKSPININFALLPYFNLKKIQREKKIKEREENLELLIMNSPENGYNTVRI